MNDKYLQHVGILGMRWGHRMAKDGSVTTLRRGKRVPLMKSVRGKAVQVNGRSLSNVTRQKTKELVDMAKEKYSNLSTNKKTAIKLSVLVGGTALATYTTAKLGKAFMEGYNQKSYEIAIQSIAQTIIDAKNGKY